MAAFNDKNQESMMVGHRLWVPLGACLLLQGAVLASQLPRGLTAHVHGIAKVIACSGGAAPPGGGGGHGDPAAGYGGGFLERGAASGQCVHIQEIWIDGQVGANTQPDSASRRQEGLQQEGHRGGVAGARAIALPPSRVQCVLVLVMQGDVCLSIYGE